MTDDAIQTSISPFIAPWRPPLRAGRQPRMFAVIDDANDQELIRSRHFWLPEADDPEPPTLAAMRLIQACPGLIRCVAGWSSTVGSVANLAEAARACQAAVELATGRRPARGTSPTPVSPGTRPYSVLLLYPDYANDSGTETYYAFVDATGPIEAVAPCPAARPSRLQDGIENRMIPTIFAGACLVTQGPLPQRAAVQPSESTTNRERNLTIAIISRTYLPGRCVLNSTPSTPENAGQAAAEICTRPPDRAIQTKSTIAKAMTLSALVDLAGD